MKYLTITSHKDAYFALPEEERNKLGAASIKWIADYKAKRVISSAFLGQPKQSQYSLTEFDTLKNMPRPQVS
jgi:hypothetical protein